METINKLIIKKIEPVVKSLPQSKDTRLGLRKADNSYFI